MNKGKTITGLLAGTTLVIAGGLLAKPADAAILAQYTFSNGLNSSDTNTDSTASAFGGGPGLSPRISDFRGDPTPSVAVTFGNLQSSSRTTALGLGTYYNFSLTPNAGQRVKLDSLSFGTNVGPSNLAGVAGNYFVQYSTNGGTTFSDIGPTFTEASTPPPNGNVTFTTRNIDLNGLNNMPFFTTPVAFRIYEYKNLANNNATNGGLRVDNVVLQGDVSPVPELSTGLMVMMGMMGMGFFAMRRKKDGSAVGNASFAL